MALWQALQAAWEGVRPSRAAGPSCALCEAVTGVNRLSGLCAECELEQLREMRWWTLDN